MQVALKWQAYLDADFHLQGILDPNTGTQIRGLKYEASSIGTEARSVKLAKLPKEEL